MSETGSPWRTLRTIAEGLIVGGVVAAGIILVPPPWAFLVYALILWWCANIIVLLAPSRCPVCGKWGSAPIPREPGHQNRRVYDLRRVHRHDVIRTCPEHWIQVAMAARIANARNDG